MNKSKTEIRTTCCHKGWLGLIYAIAMFSTPLWPIFEDINAWKGIYFLFIICGCMALFIAIMYGWSYTLSDAGIKCYLFGIRLRVIKWEEIKDAIVLKTGDRSGMKGVLLAFDGGMICRPKGEVNKWGVSDDSIGDLCMQNKGLFWSIVRGKNHFIIALNNKKWESALQLIQAKVGLEGTE